MATQTLMRCWFVANSVLALGALLLGCGSGQPRQMQPQDNADQAGEQADAGGANVEAALENTPAPAGLSEVDDLDEYRWFAIAAPDRVTVVRVGDQLEVESWDAWLQQEHAQRRSPSTGDVRWSRDGRHLAFVVSGYDVEPQLWMAQIDEAGSRSWQAQAPQLALLGTELIWVGDEALLIKSSDSSGGRFFTDYWFLRADPDAAVEHIDTYSGSTAIYSSPVATVFPVGLPSRAELMLAQGNEPPTEWQPQPTRIDLEQPLMSAQLAWSHDARRGVWITQALAEEDGDVLSDAPTPDLRTEQDGLEIGQVNLPGDYWYEAEQLMARTAAVELSPSGSQAFVRLSGSHTTSATFTELHEIDPFVSPAQQDWGSGRTIDFGSYVGFGVLGEQAYYFFDKTQEVNEKGFEYLRLMVHRGGKDEQVEIPKVVSLNVYFANAEHLVAYGFDTELTSVFHVDMTETELVARDLQIMTSSSMSASEALPCGTRDRTFERQLAACSALLMGSRRSTHYQGETTQEALEYPWLLLIDGEPQALPLDAQGAGWLPGQARLVVTRNGMGTQLLYGERFEQELSLSDAYGALYMPAFW